MVGTQMFKMGWVLLKLARMGAAEIGIYCWELTVWEPTIWDLIVWDLTFWEFTIWELTIWEPTIWELIFWEFTIWEPTILDTTSHMPRNMFWQESEIFSCLFTSCQLFVYFKSAVCLHCQLFVYILSAVCLHFVSCWFFGH